jgi:GNAT superfamily N-acetyltransferase
MDEELIIRPARPGDRPAMERICARTWEWGDYIPEVWDGWLADEGGAVLVGDLGGQVVALSKITFQPLGQVWLEGMRVDPGYRGQHIASRFLDHSLDDARRRGARVVRLGTSGNNTPVHIMATRAGMERVGAYVLWLGESSPEGPLPAVLAPGHAAPVQAFLDGSALLACMAGLYSVGWAWQELSPARVAQFLETGQMLARLATDGSLLALAAVDFDPEDGDLWIGFVDGQHSAVGDLALAVRRYAAQIGAAKVRVMLPDFDWLQDAFRRAGYGFGDWEGQLWIFERRLGGSAEDSRDG